MNTFIVSVNYTDLISLTLPHDRHHHSRVTVVTDLSVDVELMELCRNHEAELYCTDAFYRNGADFNKWLALEEAIAHVDPKGWICLKDADTAWPKEAPLDLVKGNLYTPYRRMHPETPKELPPESVWTLYPVHRNTSEWAGYSQIFHADDPVLGPRPWHQIDWRHAGGADSFFQQKWKVQNKIRPSWDCLHIGASGVNWCGRATADADGKLPEGADAKIAKLRGYMNTRRRSGQFISERIGG